MFWLPIINQITKTPEYTYIQNDQAMFQAT